MFLTLIFRFLNGSVVRLLGGDLGYGGWSQPSDGGGAIQDWSMVMV